MTRFDAMPIGSHRAILNSIRDPVNLTDRDYRVVWANEAKARFHQLDLHDMIGRLCHELFRRRFDPCPGCPVRAVFDSGKPCILERSVTLPDGSHKPTNVRCYPVFNDKGNVSQVLQIMIDLTRRRPDAVRQKRRIEFLEKTIREINGESARSLAEQERPKVESLTEREAEVLGLIANGLSNVEIGKVLAISPHTVKTHLINIFGKFNVNDRTQAAILAVRKKLI